MEKIKKGDVLVCIDATDVTLTEGDSYKVLEEPDLNGLLMVNNDSEVGMFYKSSRFRKKEIPQLTAPLDLIKQIAEANPAFKAEAERIWPDAFPVPVPEIKLEKPDSGYGSYVLVTDVNYPDEADNPGYWAVALIDGKINLNAEKFDWKIEGDKLIPTRKP